MSTPVDTSLVVQFAFANGAEFSLRLKRNDTLSHVKRRVYKKCGVFMRMQQLAIVAACGEFEFLDNDSATLSAYGVKDGTVVGIIVR